MWLHGQSSHNSIAIVQSSVSSWYASSRNEIAQPQNFNPLTDQAVCNIDSSGSFLLLYCSVPSVLFCGFFLLYFSEWVVNQHRDSIASYIGHDNLLSYFGVVENETKARVKYNLLQVRLVGDYTHTELRDVIVSSTSIASL